MLMKMKGRTQSLLGIALGAALVVVLLLVSLNLLTTPEGARDLRGELIELVEREILSAEDPEAAAEAAGMTEKQLRKWKQFVRRYAGGDREFLMEDLTEQLPEGYADQLKARKLEDVIVLMPGKTLTRLTYGELDLEHEPLGRTVSDDFPVVAGVCIGVAGVALALCAWLIKGSSRPLWTGMLLGVVIAVALLALAFAVPSSPPTLVDDMAAMSYVAFMAPDEIQDVYEGNVYFNERPVGVPVTYYALWLTVGAAAAIAWVAYRSSRDHGDMLSGVVLALGSGACALILSHVLYCVLNKGYIANTLFSAMETDRILPGQMLVSPWLGGFTMYGAIYGVLAGALIFALVRRTSFAKVMDTIIPGVLLLIAFGRFAEQYTGQGVGSYNASEAFGGLRFAIPFMGVNEYGEAVLQVYMYEALVAVGALIAALEVEKRGVPGRAAETGLAIVSAAQIMLESIRGDETIKFGFVCPNMIMAMTILAFILVCNIVRVVRSRGWKPWTFVRMALVLLSAAVVIIVEFGLHGKFGIETPNAILWLQQAAAVTVMCAAVLLQDGRTAPDAEPVPAPEAPEADVKVKA